MPGQGSCKRELYRHLVCVHIIPSESPTFALGLSPAAWPLGLEVNTKYIFRYGSPKTMSSPIFFVREGLGGVGSVDE